MSALASLREPAARPGGRAAAGRSRCAPYVLLAPGLVWLAVFFIVPIITLVSTSLQTGSVEQGFALTFRLANYTDAWTAYGPQFVRSFGYALAATVLALLISYPLAYTMAFRARRWRHVMLVLVVAPFCTSFLIRTLAWRTILSDDGAVVGALESLGVLRALSVVGLTADDRVLATPLAVVIGLTYNVLPFMTLPLYVSLERLDRRLVEAAEDLYASPVTAFGTVVLPLSLPGVVAGTVLTFIPAAGDFVNAQLLGSLPRTSMVGNVIEARFLRVLHYPSAAALSVSLMVAIVVLVSAYVRRAGTEELL